MRQHVSNVSDPLYAALANHCNTAILDLHQDLEVFWPWVEELI